MNASIQRALAAALLASLLWLPGGSAAATEQDTELLRLIDERLAPIREQEAAAIRAVVHDGRVVLQGTVSLLDHALRAEQVVWQTPGVVDVDNELRVVPLGVRGDAAIERRVRTLIKGDERFLDTSLELSVRAGIVEITGRFHDPSDVLALKHRVALVPGVLEVRIDAVFVASTGARPGVAA